MNDGSAAFGRPEPPASQAVHRALPAWASVILQACLWGSVAVLGFDFARFTTSAATRSSGGFVAYYTAARLLRQGVPVSQFYDDEWFRAEVQRYDPAIGDIYNPNPPTTALMLLPLAGLDYRAARIAWTDINLVIWATAIGWMLWRLDFRGHWLAGAIALALVYQPTRANFWYGQAYVLLLGLSVLAWEGYRCRRDGLLGGALAGMMLLKTAGVWLVPLLIAQRRWRALGWGLASMVCLVAASLPWLGVDAWLTCLSLLPGLIDRPEIAVTAYQTQWSLARHLFTFDANRNPAPMFDAPALAFWLLAVSALALVGISVYRAIHTDLADRSFALFAAIGLILSPASLDYHYTLLLLPIAIVIARTRHEPFSWRWLVLAVSVWMIAADLPYRSPALSEGAAALLAYPKLYGAWLLSVIAMSGSPRTA